MQIRDMTEHESIDFLSKNNFGHLGCASGGYPYVVPLNYVYDMGKLFMFSLPGHKIDCMRADDHACFQIEAFTQNRMWKSVLVQGLYHELTDTPNRRDERIYAWKLLQKRELWWEPGSFKPQEDVAQGADAPVFFSITMEIVTGRHAVPSHDDPELI